MKSKTQDLRPNTLSKLTTNFHSFFHPYDKRPNFLAHRQTLAGLYVKLPTMQSTFNDVAGTSRLWIVATHVRTEVLGGIVFAIYIVDRDFIAVG